LSIIIELFLLILKQIQQTLFQIEISETRASFNVEELHLSLECSVDFIPSDASLTVNEPHHAHGAYAFLFRSLSTEDAAAAQDFGHAERTEDATINDRSALFLMFGDSEAQLADMEKTGDLLSGLRNPTECLVFDF
jgi:hypothetical protein